MVGRREILLILSIILLGCAYGRAQFLDLKFTHITSDHGLPQSTIHGISKDKYGFMWFGTWSGLCRYDGYKFRVYNYDAQNPKSIPNNRIHNILKDSDGNLWILTFDTELVAKYNYETDDFERVAIADLSADFQDRISRRNHIERVQYRYQDQQWHLNTASNTVVETHLPSGLRKTYSTNPINPWAINDTYISDLYLDDQHILWLGSYSTGVNKTHLTAHPFGYYYHDPKNPNSINENTVNSITEDQERNIWIATRSKGINIIHPNGEYTSLTHDPTSPQTIKSNFIRKVFCDSEGYVWIGTKKGLDRYSPRSKRIEHIEHESLFDITVYGIAEDTRSDIWFATWNGIFKYNRKKDKLVHFDPSILPTRYVWSIHIDREGRIWAGTEGEGIVVLEENGDSLSVIDQLRHQTDDGRTISDNRIYGILQDRSKKIWICTGNGLDRYDPATKTILHFSREADGLPKGTISSVTEDNSGFIWVGHKKGISRIDPGCVAIRTFSKQHGLQSNEFAEGAVFRSPHSGKIFFGGNKGVNYFFPDSIKTDSTLAKVVLTELQILNQPVEVNQKINGRVVLDKPLYLTDGIQLKHGDRSIAIEFAALHYTNPMGNRYAYMLEGFDQEWINTDASQRIATYSNLNPGTYTFKVKAANSDGVWNETPTTLSIHVAPAWWASDLAYLTYALVFVSLLLLSYYYLARYTRLKSDLKYEEILHQKERDLHESKIQFFTNISHEIKTPLSLILAPIQQLGKLANEHPSIKRQLDTIKKNGDALAKIVNQLLDIQRIENGHETLKTETLDIVAFARQIFFGFEELAHEKGIDLVFSAYRHRQTWKFDSDKLEKVFNNLLSNAIKFSHPGGKVRLSIYSTDKHLILQVENSGRPIADTDLEKIFQPFNRGSIDNPSGSGLGLAYTRLLVELHGGDIQASSSASKEYNTTFTVRLPREDSAMDNESLSASGQTVRPPIGTHPNEPNTISAPLPLQSAEKLETFTLLIVEDNEEMLDYVAQHFSEHYHVLCAKNGKEGLERAQKHIPDLIISDVMMPGMDGIAFTHLLKSEPTTCHIPILLLTARTLEADQIMGLKTGADDYITKPFNLETLSLKVKNQLRYRTKLQEKFKLKVSVAPSEISPESPDEKLLKKVLQYVEDNISDSDLKVDSICDSIGLSRTQLYRKIKALTGFSMADLVRELRLKRAQQLLKEKKFNITEIAYMVGFSDPDYFRKSFKARFGQSPTEYAKSYQQSDQNI